MIKTIKKFNSASDYYIILWWVMVLAIFENDQGVLQEQIINNQSILPREWTP